MTTSSDGLIVELVPGRAGGPRLVPEHDEVTWSPGDRGVLPEPILGAAVPLLFGGEPCWMRLAERTQPRDALTLSWWVTCDWTPTVDRLASQTWPPPEGPVDQPEGPRVEPAPDDSDQPPAEPPLIGVSLVRQRSRRTRVTVSIGGDQLVETVDLDTASALDPPTETGVNAEDWHHLAVTWSGADRRIALHLDGQLVVTAPTTAAHLDHRRRPRVVIDGDAGERKILWLGPVRLHDRVRTPVELLAERHDDRATYPSIDHRNPLGFRLADDHDDPAIYITDDDVAGRTLHLVVENRSPFPIELPRARSDGAVGECLDFRFRPGCLVGGAHHWVEPHAPAWAVESAEGIDGTTSLFVGRTSPLTLTPGASTALTLHHVRADGALGAHGTHVELVYPHPHHPELTATRLAAAEVRGQRGRRTTPLRLAVLGHQTVVTNGEPNRLELSLVNTSSVHPVHFDPPIRGNGTRFVLSIDSGLRDHTWALATHEQLVVVDPSVRRLGPWQVELELQGHRPQWTLTPIRAQTLDPGQRLVIELAGLRTTMDPGWSRAELRLENVAGYWDDELRVEIEKSHLVEAEGSLEVEEDLRVVGSLTAEGAMTVGGVLTATGDVTVEGTLADRHGELLPGGVIVMWHGSAADVPGGWVLCNGDNGTPDLSDRFIRARANPATDEAGRTGGGDSVTLTTGNLPHHDHQFVTSTFTVPGPAMANVTTPGGPTWPRPTVTHDGSVSVSVFKANMKIDLTDKVHKLAQWVVHHSARLSAVRLQAVGGGGAPVGSTSVGSTGGGQSFDNRPAFYDLCFIMKRLDQGGGQ